MNQKVTFLLSFALLSLSLSRSSAKKVSEVVQDKNCVGLHKKEEILSSQNVMMRICGNDVDVWGCNEVINRLAAVISLQRTRKGYDLQMHPSALNSMQTQCTSLPFSYYSVQKYEYITSPSAFVCTKNTLITPQNAVLQLQNSSYSHSEDFHYKIAQETRRFHADLNHYPPSTVPHSSLSPNVTMWSCDRVSMSRDSTPAITSIHKIFAIGHACHV